MLAELQQNVIFRFPPQQHRIFVWLFAGMIIERLCVVSWRVNQIDSGIYLFDRSRFCSGPLLFLGLCHGVAKVSTEWRMTVGRSGEIETAVAMPR